MFTRTDLTAAEIEKINKVAFATGRALIDGAAALIGTPGDCNDLRTEGVELYYQNDDCDDHRRTAYVSFWESGEPDSPEIREAFASHKGEVERLQAIVSRVKREYRGTRLLGAIRRAGAEMALLPENREFFGL